MKDFNDLKRELQRIDGKGYKAYKDIEGQYDFKIYTLSIDHVQGDPFAAPSRVRVIIKNTIPETLFDKIYKKTAIEDYLIRCFYKNINTCSSRVFGSGKSGIISISKCSQEVIQRTAVIIDREKIEDRKSTRLNSSH